jgi:hypothetical protein
MWKPKTPDPGGYEVPFVTPMTPRRPSWTFGGKSRRKKGWGRRPKGKKLSIVVGGFTVLVPEEEYEYAREVLEINMELRGIFNWVMGDILERKPLAPLGTFRERFRMLQRGESESAGSSDR